MNDKLKHWADVRPGFWFAPRLFGLGATPVTWQGWLVTLLGIGAIVAVARSDMRPGLRGVLLLILLCALVWISWRKTDGAWRWRWGSLDR